MLLFYLSYGSTITDTKSRMSTLIRYDGVETLAEILGTTLSPFLFSLGGFYASYFGRYYIISIIKTCQQLFFLCQKVR